jgi:site-specific DNA-cytosine methylase
MKTQISVSMCNGVGTSHLVAKKIFPNVKMLHITFDIDKKANEVSKFHNPDEIQLGDLRNWRKNKHLFKNGVLNFDAGTCCAHLSMAGDREGFYAKNGTLVDSLKIYKKLVKEGVEMNLSIICFWESVWFIQDIKPTYYFFEIPPMASEFMNIFKKGIGPGHTMITLDAKKLSGMLRKRHYFVNYPYMGDPKDKGITIRDIIPNAKGAWSIHGTKNPKYGEEGEFKYGVSKVNIKEDKLYTITTKGGHVILDDDTIRPYTPEEAEQFMGFPVGYTNVGKISKTKRLFLLGNSWSVDVVTHIKKSIRQTEYYKKYLKP